MDPFIIATAAFLAATLTLFTGFGLGTLLMPVLALFFPVEGAIAMTALVHLANNLFKLGLLGRHADRGVVLRFGLPAMVAALGGAWLLRWLADLPPLWQYAAQGRVWQVMPVKLIVGLLMLLFVGLELHPALARVRFGVRLLPLGGLLSGFFGGLSGSQGAFRSLFLLKAGLSKEQFVATGVVLAVLVDLARLPVYGLGWGQGAGAPDSGSVALACLAAFAGSFAGARLLPKITLTTLRWTVSLLLTLVALGLISGRL